MEGNVCSGNSELGEVEIKRGNLSRRFFIPFSICFSIDSIKFDLKKGECNIYEFSESREILFMDDLKLYSRSEKELDSLIQTVCVFSKDIGMEFGMEKGKIVKSVGIELPDGKVIKSLQEGVKVTSI